MRRVALFVAALALLLAAPARAATTTTPARYAKTLGQGFSADWFASATGPARYRHATAVAVRNAGFRHLRLRVRADRKLDLATLKRVIDDIRSTGLAVVVSWENPTAARKPTAARLRSYKRWFTQLATGLRKEPSTVSLMLFGDLAGTGVAKPRSYRAWSKAGLAAVRAVDRRRLVIVPAPAGDPKTLRSVSRTDKHVLPEWHRWPAGPTHARGGTQWIGDGSAVGRKQVDNAVASARKRRPTYLGAWSPLDRKHHTLSSQESVQFAGYVKAKLASAKIPWTLSTLDDYFDESTGQWRGGDPATVLGTLAPAPTTTTVAKPQLAVDQMQFAQTHVLPPAGRSWTLTDGTKTTAQHALHLVGGRAALALVKLGSTGAVHPQLIGSSGTTTLGSVDLTAGIPPTEDSGPAYASGLYSATIPASWMRPGLQVRVQADNFAASAATVPTIGADPSFAVKVLPFYLFGATEANTKPLSVVGTPPADAVAAMNAVWPVAQLQVANHPAGKISWPTLVVGPNEGRPAYVAHNASEYQDGFDGLSTLHGIVSDLRDANGDGPLDVQYYAPLLALDNKGQSASAGGGIGGGSVGTGDDSYTGIFIHEQGHAFGLPHAGEAFDDHEYPYEWGSLNGSNWGFDQNSNQFLAPFIPPSADTYKDCAKDTFGGHPRAVVDGRCIKQDPMQSGSGDQSSGERYDTFSDYSTAVMQEYLEDRIEPAGSGYRRWNTTTLSYDSVDTATTGNAQSGFNQGLPVTRDVPVYAIEFTRSHAGTAGATVVYPAVKFTGNLLKTIDPTNAADRAEIDPKGSGDGHWYCINSGCDLSLRVSYSDGTTRTILVPMGFRAFSKPDGADATGASDATNGASFKSSAVNVPATSTIKKVELLDTPQGYAGLPANPAVLASWTP